MNKIYLVLLYYYRTPRTVPNTKEAVTFYK